MLSSWTGLLLLLLASIAAAASSEALDPRLAKYHTLAAKNDGVLPLTSANYDELVSLNGPAGAGSGRNYSISVILTALNPKFGCAPCQAFDKEHREVAKQWWAKSRKAGGQAAQMKHIFGVLDFEKGQEIFKRMGLNTAPLGQLFLPSSSNAVSYDFNRQGPSAEAFASFVASQTGLPVTYSRPVDYSRVATTVTTLVTVLVAASIFWGTVKRFLLSRWLWALVSLAFILPMISGYMWNQIRHPPYMQVSRTGQPQYIAAGYSNQYSVETPIISLIYGILAFSTYTLTVTLPNLSHDKFRQRIGVYLWTIIVILMASVLVAIFSIKNPGYPFKLLF